MYVLGFGNTTQQDENVVVGIGNEATVGSAYIFGQGITNTKNGTVDIGYGDSGKITVDGQGTLTLRGALDVSNGVGSAGQILMSQGGGLSPVWSDQSSLFANLPANNGLTNSSGTLQLGGSLVQNTSVNQMGYTFGFTGGNVGIGTSTPKNTLEVTSAVAGTSGLRLTNLTSATSSSTSSNKVLTVDANGDLVLAIVPGTQNIVDFSVNANPNTAGTTFSPNLPQNADVIYTSTIDNSMWQWNGSSYVTYVPVNTNWSLRGNAGTTAGTNFLGTTDAQALVFKTNNTQSGYISTTGGNSNLSLGLSALNPATTGTMNTALGTLALTANTTGVNNTAVGTSALAANTTGYSNTAVGYLALSSNTTAVENTATGYGSLKYNTTGSQNSAFGRGAMNQNTSGAQNTSVGTNAL